MKVDRKNELISNILNSNLSKKDKEEIVNFLNKDGITMDDVVQYVISFWKIGKETLKLFDIDLGDD
jgi:hypothetical protein